MGSGPTLEGEKRNLQASPVRRRGRGRTVASIRSTSFRNEKNDEGALAAGVGVKKGDIVWNTLRGGRD